MATVVIMPKQGQSVESCIITEWNKKKGDQVTKGEILFAYETDKASFEEEAAIDGILLELFYEAGDEVPVLTNVCVIGAAGESAEAYRPGGAAEKNVEISETVVKQEATTAKTEELISKVASQEVGTGAISPRAKILADKEGILTTGLSGTGPKGRIIEQDVLAVIACSPKTTPLAKKIAGKEQLQPAATGSGLGGSVTAKDLTTPNPVYSNDFEIKKLSNMRKMIAKAMLSSLQNSAQLTHHLGADARRMLELRRKVKKANDNGYPVNITINDMVCFAVVKALRKFPQANGHFLGDSVKYFNKIHLGVAVDTDRGLMVPAIRNADDLSIQGLSNQMREIAASCRKGAINPELLSSEAASFTVSNLGNYGVEMFTPVINLPQVGILGVNTIVPRPKDLGDGVYGFVPFIGLSLTYDHQALDGGEATRFLKQIAIEIENLEFEL
ncbi:MAG TPA: dihydrolipoamide acetyltransferase family protein [Prolixibacteraceae bacterium]|nr:dihydrolipoamide acetyltransferase family protein [Prolixibacteraceae bacterium]